MKNNSQIPRNQIVLLIGIFLAVLLLVILCVMRLSPSNEHDSQDELPIDYVEQQAEKNPTAETTDQTPVSNDADNDPSSAESPQKTPTQTEQHESAPLPSQENELPMDWN